MRRRPGQPCTKCCAITRAMCCSIIWVCAKTTGMILRPECADFPYFLRATSRSRWGCRSAIRIARAAASATNGSTLSIPRQRVPRRRPNQKSRPPPWRCPSRSAEPAATALAPAGVTSLKRTLSFGEYLRIVGDVVHSGSVRTSANDDNTDFYTVPLTQETLRPGTVYADPYGHVMLLVRRVPQSAGAAGVLLAVDAEPDGTVARKRFWRGTFLFAHEPSFGSAGFRALPANRARGKRRLAATNQCPNRKKCGLRRFFARTIAARGRRFL